MCGAYKRINRKRYNISIYNIPLVNYVINTYTDADGVIESSKYSSSDIQNAIQFLLFGFIKKKVNLDITSEVDEIVSDANKKGKNYLPHCPTDRYAIFIFSFEKWTEESECLCPQIPATEQVIFISVSVADIPIPCEFKDWGNLICPAVYSKPITVVDKRIITFSGGSRPIIVNSVDPVDQDKNYAIGFGESVLLTGNVTIYIVTFPVPHAGKINKLQIAITTAYHHEDMDKNINLDLNVKVVNFSIQHNHNNFTEFVNIGKDIKLEEVIHLSFTLEDETDEINEKIHLSSTGLFPISMNVSPGDQVGIEFSTKSTSIYLEFYVSASITYEIITKPHYI